MKSKFALFGKKYGSIQNGKEDLILITTTPSKRKCIEFNRCFVACKLAYLFLGTKTGTLVPFSVIFLQSVGLSLEQAGISYSIGFIGLILGNIFWTFIADKRQLHRLIYWIVSIFALLFLCAQPFTTLLFGSMHYTKCPNQNADFVRNVSSTNPNNRNDFNMKRSKNNLFWILTALNFLGYFCDGSTLSLVDAAVTMKIKASTTTVNFGHQRMFNSVGFGLGSLLSSFLSNNMPITPISCYVGLFIVYAVAALPAVLCGDMLLKDLIITTNDSERKSTSWRKTSLFDVSLFLCTSIVVGLLYGVNRSFTMFYIKVLGGSAIIVGVCQLVAALSAIFTYIVSHKLIELLKGEWNALYICCFIWAVRYIFYIFVKNPLLFFLSQSLHGFCISLFVAAIARFAQINISRNSFTIFFGVADAFINGLGPCIANLSGGFIYGNYGHNVLFGSMVALSASWLFIAYALRNCRRKFSECAAW